MGAIPRNGGSTARSGLTGAMARPGTRPNADFGGAGVHDPNMDAQIQQLLPKMLGQAPKGFGAGPHGGGMSGDASSAWLTGELRKAGVPLQDGQHVLPTGQVVKDPSWWDRYGGAVMLAASGLAGGYMLGAIPGLGGAAANGVEWGGAADGVVGGGVSMGMPDALPVALGAGPEVGEGVLPGLLGPSAETASDLAGGAGVTAGASSAAGGGGFLSSLAGKGGGLLKTLAGAGSGIAITAGSIEAQRAKAAAEAARIQQDQDRLAQSRALIGLRAPSMQAANSVRGDVLANSQDATFSGLPSYVHVPTMSGGLRPSMLSDNSRTLGAGMSRDALAHQLAHDDVPDLTPLPSSGGWDSLLQGLAIGGGLLSTLKGLGGSGSSAGPSTGGGYNGPGTPGYPGDGKSPINPMIPPVPTDGMDPNEMAWWQQQAAGGFA